MPDIQHITAKKPKRLGPLQGDEAAKEGTATGFGGERRRRAVDDAVDEAQGVNRKRRAQTTDSANRY